MRLEDGFGPEYSNRVQASNQKTRGKIDELEKSKTGDDAGGTHHKGVRIITHFESLFY